MQRRRAFRAARWMSTTAALALALVVSPPAGAQVLVPQGAEFQVNSYTPLPPDSPSVAADADGDFVVVWSFSSYDGQYGTDTSYLSIHGRRYASDGSEQGVPFQVNTYTTGRQYRADAAADADGDFIVVWESYGSNGTDTEHRSVQGQRYSSDGSPQGAEFQVNTYTPHSQFRASVAADADGDFVVVWESVGSAGTDTSYRSIHGQRYDSSGSPQGDEFQVNTWTTNYQIRASVAADADGDFVVVWQSYGSSGTDESGYSVQGQRYASDGSTQGDQFQVNTYTTGFQTSPSVAARPDGDFVVVWRSDGSYGTDTSGFSLNGQRYASDGSAQGAEFQVNAYTTGDQVYPSVAAAADGNFVVVWESPGSYGTDTSSGSVQGQFFSSFGQQGTEFQVNTYTTDRQSSASVAATDDGFVVVWRGDGAPSNSLIFGQRYGTAVSVPAMSSATRFALGAALLLLAACVLRRRS